MITWDVNDSRAGGQRRRSEGPRGGNGLPSCTWPAHSPVGRHHLQGLCGAHLCTTWKQAELRGPSETCISPAGEQFGAGALHQEEPNSAGDPTPGGALCIMDRAHLRRWGQLREGRLREEVERGGGALVGTEGWGGKVCRERGRKAERWFDEETEVSAWKPGAEVPPRALVLVGGAFLWLKG